MTTRIEVIDYTKDSKYGGGRVFVAYDSIEVVKQDGGRTLKVFIRDE